jgi:ElaB/YqjD/DUF883 family membrane-anchored ribosome-binding protein
MTEVASRETGGESLTGQAQQQVGEKAREVRGQVSETVRRRVDDRSTQAGDQLSTVAQAMRRTGDNLRQEGNEAPAKVTDSISERMERLGEYLRNSDADAIFRDVEQAARRRPWAFAAGGVVIGLIAARFVRASAGGTSQGTSWSSGDGRALPVAEEPEIVFEPVGDVEFPSGARNGA